MRIKHIINRNIKNTKVKYDIPNTVYSFLCPCKKEYIGESSLRLIHRIRSHCSQKEQSSIIYHVENCKTFKSEFLNFCIAEKIIKSCQKSRMAFLQEFFTVLIKGTNTYQRRWIEGYLIKTRDPFLNKMDDYVYNIRMTTCIYNSDYR